MARSERSMTPRRTAVNFLPVLHTVRWGADYLLPGRVRMAGLKKHPPAGYPYIAWGAGNENQDRAKKQQFAVCRAAAAVVALELYCSVVVCYRRKVRHSTHRTCAQGTVSTIPVTLLASRLQYEY